MPVGIGVLGLAHGHLESYWGQWEQRPELDVKVLAVWDHDASRMEAVKQKHGVETCATPEELLARADIQAIFIAAETSLHVDMVEKAAAAGKSIVLQKPFALNIAQGERIVAAVKKYNVPFSMAWQMRVDAGNLKMKEMIENETLGRVINVRRRHALSVHTWQGFEDTWHNSPIYNRDIWADDSSHPIDWINSIFGAPDSVTAELATIMNPKVPNDNGIVIFKYKDGPLVEVNCSFTCVAEVVSTEIICAGGTIIHNFGDASSCSIPRPDGDCGLKWFSLSENKWFYSDIPTPAQHWERISALAKPIADFYTGKGGAIATAEEALLSLRMVLATYVSNAEGRRVKLDDPAIGRIV